MKTASIFLSFFACASVACNGLADIETYLTLENDTFVVPSTDNDYTHGTKLELVDTNSGFHYMASQTMYAPDDLSLEHHVKGDRPYCGMALFGIGHELHPFSDNILHPDEGEQSPWSHYVELDFGMIGPAAGCKWTQRTIHKWLGCKEPKGWDDQLHNEFVVNAQYWLKYNYYICDYAALVPRLGLSAGTIQDYADVGVDLKVGYNIKPSPSSPLIFSAPRQNFLSKMSCYAFAGIGERYYLYNHILEGSLFTHKDDDLTVDIYPFVSEVRFGAVFSYDRFYISYIGVLRTDEYKHEKSNPYYGGICIGWTF